MPFDTKSFRPVDWVIAATGLISLVALFLPWWGVTVLGYSASVSGWHTSYGWLGGLLVVVAAGWYVLSRRDTALPPLPVSTSVATLGVSLLGLLIILVRWLTLPRGQGQGHFFQYGGRAGIWIAALAAAAQVGALLVVFRQSGEPLPWRSGGRGGRRY
jgi:hypothetical protein